MNSDYIKYLMGEECDEKDKNKYSIEKHGENFTLFFRHEPWHHGYNLCTLIDFDYNKDQTIKMIEDALNKETEVCIWTHKKSAIYTDCGNTSNWPVDDKHEFCPFCGKRRLSVMEVEEHNES
jgi:wobble nucleotide-excising tRNase